jgi:hypothetical protein
VVVAVAMAMTAMATVMVETKATLMMSMKAALLDGRLEAMPPPKQL